MPYFPQSDALVLPAPVLSYRNILGRNGGFEVWQRGAGGSASFGVAGTTSQYTADGWYMSAPVNCLTSVAQTAPLTAGSRYGAFVGRQTGQTGTTQNLFEFPLDVDEVVSMRGQVVTLSMSMVAGANFSPAGGAVTCYLITGTGANAARLASMAGSVTVLTGNIVLTGATTRFVFTSSIVVPTNATQGTVLLSWFPVGTAGAVDGFVIDDVQLEVGSVATPFERRPFDSELLACQRHYCKTFAYAAAPASAVPLGHQAFPQPVAASNTFMSTEWCFPVRMRAAPTLVSYNPQAAGSQIRNTWAGLDCTGTAANTSSDRSTSFSATTPATTAAGQGMGLQLTADAGI